MPSSKLRLTLAVLTASLACTVLAHAQDPKSVCANLVAHRDGVTNGTFANDQLAAMIHGTPASDLVVRAEGNADKNDHYSACANYMLATAAYRTRGDQHAKQDMQSAVDMAILEQMLADGKQLTWRQRTGMSMMRKGFDLERKGDAMQAAK